MTEIHFILLTSFATLLLLWAEKKSSRLGVWIFKTTASLGFLGLGFHQYQNFLPQSLPAKAVLVGLILCLLGDILLIPKNKKSFLAGVGSFLFGHVAYSASFIERGITSSILWTLPCIAVITLLVARFIIPHLVRKDPSMKIPVILYMVVISIMVGLSISTSLLLQRWIFAAGALLFYFSDLSVALEKFVSPGLKHKLWGLPLYYLAQLIIACSL